MAARAVNTVSDRQGAKRVFEVEAVDQIIASNRQLAKKMFEMQKQFQEVKLLHSNSAPKCVTCGGPNCGERCLETIPEEEGKYMGQHAPYSNTYNQGWKNHPNPSWGDRGNNFQKPYNNQGFQGHGARPQEQSSGKKSVEDLLGDFLAHQEEANKKRYVAMRQQEASMRQHETSMRNLEHQVGQLAKRISERDTGKFPSDTQEPRVENASAITTRSGKVLPTVEMPVEEVVVEEERVEKKNEGEKIKEGEKSEKVNKVPFPKALVKKNLEKQFSKFVTMFRKLHVDLPF